MRIAERAMSDAKAKIVSLKQQLSDTNKMVMTAMRSSSDLGIVVQFLKESFDISTYEALALRLIDTLENFDLHASVSIDTYTGRIFIDKGDEKQTLEDIAFLKQNLLCGRIVEKESAIQINYDNTSVLVTNLPENNERKGQLKDSLALLLDGVQSRVKSLILEEKEREAQQSKNEFFALMSHELRTPLNPIIGFSSRLERKVGSEIDEKFGQTINMIRHNGENLLRLLNHIIDVSAVESGNIALNPYEFNVADNIDRALFKIEALAKNKNTIIKKDIPRDLSMISDPSRFIDTVISLCSYAINASSNHTLTVSAQYENVTKQCILIIRDTGQTISEAYQTKIFDHFANRKLGSICESNDLGIGLYLTKKIVELQGGSIKLESNEQVGNIFTVTYPQEI